VGGPERLSIGILAGGSDAPWLNECLERIKPSGIPAYVLASHQKDEIPAACERHGARYHFAPPGDSFSFAERRNLLVSLCPLPWLLILDVDERIDGFSLDQARGLSRKSPDHAYMVRHTYYGKEGLILTDHQPRLVPASDSWRFEGHISVTLRQEHSGVESILPCNMLIQDMGAVLDPGRIKGRRDRARVLTRWEMKRLAALARDAKKNESSQLGFRYFIIGRQRAAYHFWRRIEERDPDNIAAQFYLGRIEQRQGPDGAIMAVERWQKLIERKTSYYSVYRYQVKQLGGMGRWAEALQCAQLGAGLHPNDAAMLHLAAFTSYKCDDLDRARKSLDQCRALNPSYPLLDKLAMLLEHEESLATRSTKHG
jgi:hypothetical protein